MISNENYYAPCPECRKRGVNNRTEITGFMYKDKKYVACGDCKKFIRGELERDVPELNIKLNSTRLDTQHIPNPTKPFIAPETVEVGNEFQEIAVKLADNIDNILKQEIMDSIDTDKELIASILSNPKLFSLKELNRHWARLKQSGFGTNDNESEIDFHGIVLNSVKGESECQLQEPPQDLEITKTSPSKRGRGRPRKVGRPKRKKRSSQGKAKDLGMESPTNAILEDLKASQEVNEITEAATEYVRNL